jgi:hypothetical protein
MFGWLKNRREKWKRSVPKQHRRSLRVIPTVEGLEARWTPDTKTWTGADQRGRDSRRKLEWRSSRPKRRGCV